jgi:hypothetical protein
MSTGREMPPQAGLTNAPLSARLKRPMGKSRLPLALLAAAITLCAGLFLLRGRRGMVDFEVNYEAGKRLRAGETLYRGEDGHYQFKYPPFSALLYVPVSFLPPGAAKTAWFLVVLGSTILVFHLSFALARPGGKQATLLRILPPLILAKYFLRELSLGQINALITALMLGMVLALVRSGEHPSPWREAAAGGLWGVSTALKPYAAIFLPYWVLRRKWRALGAGLAALALAFLGPALYFGFGGNLLVHREWVGSLSRSTPSLFDTQDNISLIAMFTKWTGRPGLSGTLYVLSVAALALGFLALMARGRKVKDPMILESGLLLALIPLVSPLGWDYTLLSSVLVIMLVLKHYETLPGPARVFLIVNSCVFGLSLYDLMGRGLYAKFMALSIPTVSALVFIGYAARLRAKELA